MYSAQESYGRELGMKLENEAKGNLFKAVKRIVRRERTLLET